MSRSKDAGRGAKEVKAGRRSTDPRSPDARAMGGRSWAAGLGCGIGLALDPGSVVFLATLLAPAILLQVFEFGRNRAASHAVLLAGLAATIPPFARLWSEIPPSLAAALDLMAHPVVIAGAWLAAGAAWLATELAALAASFWLARRDAARLARLDAEINALETEWRSLGVAASSSPGGAAAPSA